MTPSLPKSLHLVLAVASLVFVFAAEVALAEEEESSPGDTSYAMLAQTFDSFEIANNESGEFVPNDRPGLAIPRTIEPILIDGNLTDRGWNRAARATNFTETNPGDRTKPPVQTEAWITYDAENLYLAFIAEDNPEEIRASLRDRDQIFQDDFVGIMLDTYGTASWAYEIFSNPLGVQGDLRWSNGNEDSGFDIVYHTSGKITDKGYVAEMAIPFSSLRFPNSKEQTWRATFWRTHPRDTRRQYSWAATDRDEPCWPCQWGTISGFQQVKPGSKLDLLPGLTAQQISYRLDTNDPSSSFEDQKIDGQASLGARYAFTTNLIGEATFNPDFSQIESDVAQVDVNTTFALFFPERRPFFQEGGDLLRSYTDIIYTRSINDPSVAGRFTGRMNTTALAAIAARDERSFALLPFEEGSATVPIGKTNTGILRLKKNFMKDSFIAGAGTHRQWDMGGSGSVAGIDGQLRFLEKYRFEFQGIASNTREPDADTLFNQENDLDFTFDNGRYTAAFDGEEFWGHQIYASVERDARHWEFDIDYWEFSPTFRADNGFVTQNNQRRVNGWTGYFIRPETGFFNLILPNANGGQIWNFNGVSKENWVTGEVFARFKAQTEAGVTYTYNSELFQGVQFSNMSRISGWLESNFSDPVRLGAWFRVGDNIRRISNPLPGESLDLEFWGTIKPLQQLVFEPNITYSKMNVPSDRTENFSGVIFRVKAQYQFSRPLFFRLIMQYDGFSNAMEFDPLLSYKINPFSVFFLGSNHAYQDIEGARGFQQQARQFFAKVQYLFQM